MIDNNKVENTVPNIWTAQENLIHFYKILSVGLGSFSLVLLITVAAIYFRDPIVVTKYGVDQEFYPSERKSVAIEKSDVAAFAKTFLRAMYVWSDFNTKQLAKEIGPFAEDGLVVKVMDAQFQKYGKELKDKKLSQAITFLTVEVLADRVICRFDRVLKIEGIPLIIPTELTLSMIEGARTALNPMGIYVAGITERDNAK